MPRSGLSPRSGSNVPCWRVSAPTVFPSSVAGLWVVGWGRGLTPGAWVAAWTGAPSAEEERSHCSQRGRYQFQSPGSFIVAGSSTARTSVATIGTAIASPTPSIFMSTEPSVAKIANTTTITIAALAYHADPRSQRADFS